LCISRLLVFSHPCSLSFVSHPSHQSHSPITGLLHPHSHFCLVLPKRQAFSSPVLPHNFIVESPPMLRQSTTKQSSHRKSKLTPISRAQSRSRRKISTKTPSYITSTHHSTSTSNSITTRTLSKRNFFLSPLFGAAKDQRVVYEPLNSFNPITLRSTVVPVAYKFPSYILPSIDIVSIASRQLVTPNSADTCYIIDKTPKLLQLP